MRDSCPALRLRLTLGAAILLRCSDARVVRPSVVSSSHSLDGYGPERAVDGNEQTYWLVPGGHRMEAMS
jgi:hypothetical protein